MVTSPDAAAWLSEVQWCGVWGPGKRQEETLRE